MVDNQKSTVLKIFLHTYSLNEQHWLTCKWWVDISFDGIIPQVFIKLRNLNLIHFKNVYPIVLCWL